MKSLLILAGAVTIVGCADAGISAGEPVDTSEQGLLAPCMIDDHIANFDSGFDSDDVHSTKPTDQFCDGHYDIAYGNVQGRHLKASVVLDGEVPSFESFCESASIELTAYGEWVNKITRRSYWNAVGTTTCEGKWVPFGPDAGGGTGGTAGTAGSAGQSSMEGVCQLYCDMEFDNFGYRRMRLQVEANSGGGSMVEVFTTVQ